MTIALVPTMGALHAGHRTLIRAARLRCDAVVVSIFVNPTQFGPQEDFARYPRRLRHDQALCKAEGVDVVFAPDTAARVRAAVETLPIEQREAVVLAYFGGLTFREVAARLGLPEGTAKSRLRLALGKLSHVLSAEGVTSWT